jgi:hypothetical protein
MWGAQTFLMLGITPHFWVLKIDSISIVSSQFGFVIEILSKHELKQQDKLEQHVQSESHQESSQTLSDLS